MNEQLKYIHESPLRAFHHRLAQYEDVIDFTIGDPFGHADERIIEAAVHSLTENEIHYCENQGLSELREKISAHRIYYSKDEILITSGSTQGLFEACLTLLNENDGVLVAMPCYPAYLSLLKLLKCEIQPFYLDDNYQLKEIPVQKNTKAILINYPHNPSGTCLNEASIRLLHKTLNQHEIMCIWDAVYDECIETLSLYHPHYHRQLICIHSFSKSYHMSGFRIGYVCAEKSMIHEMTKVHQLIQTCLPVFIQKAAAAALDTVPCSYDEQKAYIVSRLKKMKLEINETSGPFYVYADISSLNISSDEFADKLLREQQVGVLSSSCFHDTSHIRLSCCIELEKCKEGCDRMEAFVKKYENL